jgi:aspartyl/asparaginyl-tRNA synthetase
MKRIGFGLFTLLHQNSIKSPSQGFGWGVERLNTTFMALSTRRLNKVSGFSRMGAKKPA